jgi:hypothetical protein
MAEAAKSERNAAARFLLVWVLPIMLGGAVAFAPPILGDGDTFWHIAAGRWMTAHGQVPRADPFSFTFAGRPWLAHEWLAEVAMAAAYLAAAWQGVMLLTGLAAGAIAALGARYLLRWCSPLTTFTTLAIGLGCVAPGMLARPHFLVLPVAAVWTIWLLDARESNRAPSLWLALLMALWANLHSSFVVGLALLLAFGLEALLDVRHWSRPALLGWIGVAALCAVAMLATPHGLDGLAFPIRVLNMKTLASITEWRGPDFLRLEPVEIALLTGLFALLWRGVRLTAVRALILLGLVHMSLQHVRQEVLLGALGPLIVAEPLGRALGAEQPLAVPWRLPGPQGAIAAALAVVVLAARLTVPAVRLDGPTAPVSALKQVPPALRAQPVLNAYNFGGYLIFEGVRPYIDGRADLYGDAFVANDDAIQRGDAGALAAALKRYPIRWAILAAGQPVVGALEATPGWRRTYADDFAVVLVNTAP